MPAHRNKHQSLFHYSAKPISWLTRLPAGGHSYIGIALLIILVLPIVVLAHGEEHLTSDFEAQAGVLPGETHYFLDRLGEWFEVNLLTLSTKKKQGKRLKFAAERVAELGRLLELRGEPGETIAPRSLRRAADLYGRELMRAREMAEVIIFLDGAEIGLAERFEEITRSQEIIFHNLAGLTDGDTQAIVSQALILARLENESIFKFMVEKYQSDEQDIRKHQEILDRHVAYVAKEAEHGLENGRLSDEDLGRIEEFLTEAKKFRDAGLNIQSYEFLNRAKNILY